MIITIGRECGSGGHELGEALAAHYGISLYDRKILVEKAKQKGMFDEMETFFDEKPVDSLLYAIAMSNAMEDKTKREIEVLRSLITEPSFILVGRCGSFAYRDYPDCVSLFLHRKLEERVDKTMQRQDITRTEAEKLVHYVDEKRASFHKYYTNQEWSDVRNYSLTLDATGLETMQLLTMVERFVEFRIKTK